jgi:hypothetical protein
MRVDFSQFPPYDTSGDIDLGEVDFDRFVETSSLLGA